MMNLGLKSTFPRLYNTVVKKQELIIEEVHIKADAEMGRVLAENLQGALPAIVEQEVPDTIKFL